MNDNSDEINKHVSDRVSDTWPNLDPSRWWFASSAFPMIAGTLGPVASAFSICALVKPWRQSFPPGTDITTAAYIDDPSWLTAINAVQLAIAIFANMALLLNMTRRLSFTIAQPVTIVGWYISAFALIALTATASGPLKVKPAEEFVWSQAFYYGIYAAVLYFVVASLMVVTYMGALAGRYPRDFMLTASQRTLMLQTIMLLLYMLVGALVFSQIENWGYLDGVYWAAVTLFTVGFGDIYATSTLGRALVIPYALVGIISLGLVIGSIRSLALDRGKTRLGVRMVEKRRRRTLQRLARKGKEDCLVPVQDDASSTGMTEFERREREFELMRKIQDTSARRRRWFDLGISMGTWLVLWLAGAWVFKETEERYQGWNYFDAFYLAFVSLTTIGYGDLTPVSNAGKSFWVFWALLALPATTILISNAGDTVVKWVRDATDRIATVTILPSEAGFKKDFKRLLQTLSFGVLLDEDIEQEPSGLLGGTQRMKQTVKNAEDAEKGNNGQADFEDDDVNESLPQDEAGLEAEGASTTGAKQKRADRKDLEEGHRARADANAAEENEESTGAGTGLTKNPTNSSLNSSSALTKSASADPRNSQKLQRSESSLPRHNFPPTVPTSKHEMLITLVDEVHRVTQHLKHHPPRKYTFHEWAWYLRLIGEDEGDAQRHQKPGVHAHGRKGAHRVGGLLPLSLPMTSGLGRDKRKGWGGEEDGGVTSAGTRTRNGDEDVSRENEPPRDGKQEPTVGVDVITTNPGAETNTKPSPDDKPPPESNPTPIPNPNSNEPQQQNQQSPPENGNELNETTTGTEDKKEDDNKKAREEENLIKWSWVGSRSPLMGSQEEAEWILERLIARLGEELRSLESDHHVLGSLHLPSRQHGHYGGHGGEHQGRDKENRGEDQGKVYEEDDEDRVEHHHHGRD